MKFTHSARHRGPRVAGLIAVLLVHALFVSLLLWQRAPDRHDSAADVRALPITVWLQPLTVVPPVAQPAPATSGRVAPVERPPQVRPITEAAVVPNTPAAIEAPSTAIQLDLQGELAGAARRSTAPHPATETKPSFSPPPRPVSKPCKTPRGAFRFESEKPRTFGVIKLRGLGQEKEEAYGHLFDDMKAPDQPQSSVPPTECPPPA